MRLVAATLDGPLGRWTHHAWDPPHLPPALAGVVRGFWLFEGRTTHPRERAFPGGYVELIAHLGPRYRRVADPAGPDPVGARTTDPRGDVFPLVCLTGVQTAAQVIEAPRAPCRVLGIRLSPVGAYALLGCPLDAAAGRTLDLADVVGSAADALAARCADAPTPVACLAHAAAWVGERLAHSAARGHAPHPAVTCAAAALERAGGTASVTAVRAQTGLGRTRFAAAFRAQVGVGPKRYARVLRFRRALELVRAGRPLTDVALAAGFYDQAHLTASFREFAGMTPGAVATALGYPASPSLAEWD